MTATPNPGYLTPAGNSPLWKVILFPVLLPVLFILVYSIPVYAILVPASYLPESVKSLQGFRPGMELFVHLLSVTASVFICFVLIGKKTWKETPLLDPRWLPELGKGLLWGAAIMSLTVGVLATAGYYRITGFLWETDTAVMSFLIINLISLTSVALSEEVLFRAGLFQQIESYWGSYPALIISSLFFGLAHLGNPESTLFGSLAISLEAGLLLGAAYMLTRKIWLVTGLHLTWNFFQGPVFGCIISGSSSTQTGLIRPEISGPDLLTGGGFGPEGGLVAVLLATSAGVYFLIRAHQTGNVLPGPKKIRTESAPEA